MYRHVLFRERIREANPPRWTILTKRYVARAVSEPTRRRNGRFRKLRMPEFPTAARPRVTLRKTTRLAPRTASSCRNSLPERYSGFELHGRTYFFVYWRRCLEGVWSSLRSHTGMLPPRLRKGVG
jgi:hypothetical protein